MCEECGCSKPGPYKIDGRPPQKETEPHLHSHEGDHLHPHIHLHNHGHSHDDGHVRDHDRQHHFVGMNAALLGQNDRIAEQNRRYSGQRLG
jgi:hydrogenase nickel incorporation protein HypB